MINLGRTRRWAGRPGAAERTLALLTTRFVVRVTQSPINARRWSMDLACGHGLWVTAARRPKASKMLCPKCKEDVSKGEAVGRGS